MVKDEGSRRKDEYGRMKAEGIKFLILAVMVLHSFAVRAATDFSKYDVILDRKPFGLGEEALAPVPSVPKSTVPAADSFIKSYRMCAIRESSAGVSVGLVNVKVKPVRSFFLFEGEMEDGVQLVEADFTDEKALLRCGDEEHWIYMSGAVRSGGGRGAYSHRADLAAVQGSISSRMRKASPVTRPIPQMSWDEYKKMYESGKMPPARSATAVLASLRSGRDPSTIQKISREEREARRRAYNMDLIRAGGMEGVPLPIPLTPEEDAQLVSEGVLPPQ